MIHQNNTGQSDQEESHILEKRSKIGDTIRTIREKRGLSQDQLAVIMNISRSTISKIENGKFNITVDYLARFSIPLDFEFQIVER